MICSCTAQHSTAQHSTAQHSTAQHSTAQHILYSRFNFRLRAPKGTGLSFSRTISNFRKIKRGLAGVKEFGDKL